jgi:membrane-associated phospholipid phosphatase
MRRPSFTCPPALTAALIAVLVATSMPPSVLAQAVSTDATPSIYPTFERNREIVIGAIGAGSMAAGFFISTDVQLVPPEGLDPATIRFSVDRDIVGNRSTSAVTASDWARNASLLMPWVMAALTGPGGDRWHEMGPRTLVYAETFFVSMGLTAVGKKAIGRPRPYAYLPADERPDDGSFDPSKERTFFSMPSGHASAAWTATGLAMTEHLLYRPEAGWFERAGVGFIGGALATSTAVLRVEGGQHFPTDVLVGSTLGLASGVSVPLLHHGSQPLPSARAWLEMSGGALGGMLVGFLLSTAF